MAFLNDDIKINVKCSKLCDSIAADAVARLFCFSQNEVIRRCYLFGIDCCVLYGCELVQWNWMDRIINKQDFSPCAFVPNSTINYRIQGEMESFSPGMYLNWMYEWMWMRMRASIWQPFSKSARDLLQIKTQQINAFSFEWRSLRKCMLKHVRNWRRDSSHRVTRCECRFVLFFSRLFLSIYKWKTNSLKSVEFWKLLEFMSLTSNKVNSIKTNAAYDARYIQFCRERVHRKSGIMCHFCVDSTNTKTLSIVCMRNVNETEKQRTRNASGMNDDNDNNWKKIVWNCISLDLKCSFEGNLIS